MGKRGRSNQPLAISPHFLLFLWPEQVLFLVLVQWELVDQEKLAQTMGH